MSKDAIADMLTKTTLFGPLRMRTAAPWPQELRETSFDGGQVIFGRGDQGKDIFIVCSGRVRLSVLTSEGRELSFAHAEPARCSARSPCSTAASEQPTPRPVTKVTALTLSRQALMRLIETQPRGARGGDQVPLQSRARR